MKHFRVKGENRTFLEVLSEADSSLWVKITRHKDGFDEVRQEAITRHLFDMCVNTGYLIQCDLPRSAEEADRALSA